MTRARQGIYRRVSVRMWGDAKFTRLSPLKPSAQALWMYLLTGPHTTVVPGVFVAGRAAMAEALGWGQSDFDAALAEVLQAGMACYDPKTHLWFLPKAIAHNPPASPNVVRSWRACLTVLPECDLRERILEELGATLSEETGKESEKWLEAYEQALGMRPPMPSPNPSGKRSPMPLAKTLVMPSPIQEQEQEQEQETNPPSLRSGGSAGESALHLDPEPGGAEPAPVGASSASPAAQSPPTDPSVGKARKPRAQIPDCPYDEIVKAYHETLPELPSVRVLDDSRKNAIRRIWVWAFTSRLPDGSARATDAASALAWFTRYFELARSSDFLMGRSRRSAGHENWRCSIDYLVSHKGVKHVVETLQ